LVVPGRKAVIGKASMFTILLTALFIVYEV
jgi:hypothetical protein